MTNARNLLPITTRIDSTDFINVDTLSSNIIRRDANYDLGSGGPGQHVNYCLGVITTAREQTSQNEWALVGVNNNFSQDNQVENNAVYAQINKYGDSKSWAMTVEAREHKDNFSTSLVGMELDLFGNGGNKDVKTKVGIDLIIGKNNPSGSKIQPHAGLAILSLDSNSVEGKHAILIDPTENGNKPGNTWDNAIKMYDGGKITYSNNGTYFTFNPNTSAYEFYINSILSGTIPYSNNISYGQAYNTVASNFNINVAYPSLTVLNAITTSLLQNMTPYLATGLTVSLSGVYNVSISTDIKPDTNNVRIFLAVLKNGVEQTLFTHNLFFEHKDDERELSLNCLLSLNAGDRVEMAIGMTEAVSVVLSAEKYVMVCQKVN